MRIKNLLFWLCTLGLLTLGALGYVEPIWGLHVSHPRTLLIAFLVITATDRLLRYYLQTTAEKRARQFRILESHTVADRRDHLKGLAWDGTQFWITGRIRDDVGVFRLSGDFTVNASILIPDGFPYGVISSRNNLVVLVATQQRYEVRTYRQTGDLVSVAAINIAEHNMPASLATDGALFWLVIDEANVAYVLGPEFAVVSQQPLSHRVLGATYHKDQLWLTDAYRIYSYDHNLKLTDTYAYPGTTCRGISFHDAAFWSLDDGPKRIHKHRFV